MTNMNANNQHNIYYREQKATDSIQIVSNIKISKCTSTLQDTQTWKAVVEKVRGWGVLATILNSL